MINFRSYIKSQEGSILPMLAVAVVIFFIFMAVAVDFARYVLASEKLQIATDSAAVSASMSAKRYVRIEIDRGSGKDSCCYRDSKGRCRSACCIDCETIIKEGLEEKLIDNGAWQSYCCSCGCGKKPKILDRWVKYENSGAEAKTAAQTYFDINRPKEMESSSGGESSLTTVDVYNNKNSSLYPSVVVRSSGRVKTLLMNFLDKMYPGTDLSELEASRCAQGGSFYYDLDGKLHRAAVEGCN